MFKRLSTRWFLAQIFLIARHVHYVKGYKLFIPRCHALLERNVNYKLTKKVSARSVAQRCYGPSACRRSSLFSSANPIPPRNQPFSNAGNNNWGTDSISNGTQTPSSYSSSAASTTSSNKTEQNVSLLEKFDRMGLALKPKAVAARDAANALQDSQKFWSFVYSCKACLLIFLFIIYRAYRGFFVVLPAVFREVYRKMETAIESPFDEESVSAGTPVKEDINPKTGKVRLRTRITVSILSFLVTAAYVIGGACRVLVKFVKSLFSTSSVEKSFEAAADQVMVNEKQISKMAYRDRNGQRQDKKVKSTLKEANAEKSTGDNELSDEEGELLP